MKQTLFMIHSNLHLPRFSTSSFLLLLSFLIITFPFISASRYLKSSLTKTPIHDIYENSDSYLITIQSKLQLGVHPNDIDFENELSPICYASQQQNLRLITDLLLAGADVDDDRCLNSWTPLMFASSKGSMTIVELLLSSGANPYHISADAMTPYHVAADSNIQLLLEKLITSSPKYQQFLTIDGKVSLILPISSLKSKSTLAYLLKSRDSGTSLQAQKPPVLWKDINERSITMQTPLMLAAQHSQYENIKLLIDYHAHVNLQDANGWTALMYATQANCLLCIDILLTSNALSSIHSNSGESIVTLSSSPSLASNILHISLCKAITQRDFDEILSLLALGGDANTQCEYNLNYTPLIIAVKASNVQLVEILLRDYDANPNLTDSHYWSPLMFAAIQQSSSSLRILELLIEYHSDPTLRNRDDMTALQLANYLHNDASYHYLSLIPQ